MEKIFNMLCKAFQDTFSIFFACDEPLISREVQDILNHPVDRVSFRKALTELQCSDTVDLILQSGEVITLTKNY